MRKLIKRILKEETDNKWDDLKSPEISISPRTQIEAAEKKYEWDAYIPEMGKKIRFHMNPEHWNLMAGIRVEEIESKGHGDFGRDPHKEYQPVKIGSVADPDEHPIYRDNRSYWQGKNIIHSTDATEMSRRKEFYDVKEAIQDIKVFSEKTEKLTKEYKTTIQRLTKEYNQKMQEVIDSAPFNGDDTGQLVTVDKEGNYKTESDFEDDGEGWHDHHREERWDHEDYENRNI